MALVEVSARERSEIIDPRWAQPLIAFRRALGSQSPRLGEWERPRLRRLRPRTLVPDPFGLEQLLELLERLALPAPRPLGADAELGGDLVHRPVLVVALLDQVPPLVLQVGYAPGDRVELLALDELILDRLP